LLKTPTQEIISRETAGPKTMAQPRSTNFSAAKALDDLFLNDAVSLAPMRAADHRGGLTSEERAAGNSSCVDALRDRSAARHRTGIYVS